VSVPLATSEAVSFAKTGGMLNYDYYYASLGNGATYSQAYLDW
jgi:hypothetical protein